MATSLQTSERPDGASLRVRKKRMTYRTIAAAALTLTTEHGLSSVTVDQIAERAFVSPRTVSNYFVSKEAALLAAFDTGPEELLAALTARPADEHPLCSVRAAMIDEVRGWDPERLDRLRDKEAMLERYPSLTPYRLEQLEQLDLAVRSIMAARVGSDPDTDVTVQLAAGAAVVAIKTAVRTWNAMHGDADDLIAQLELAFDEVARGVPALAPSPATPSAASA